jgi:hypothetical protein
MPRPRNRASLAAAAILVAALGIGSRRFAPMLPAVISTYAGDTLWAVEAYIGILLVRPATSARAAGLVALLVSILVELSQLYHAPWIDWVRSRPLGGLVLGFGFLWSDLVCYAVGVSLASLADRILHS